MNKVQEILKMEESLCPVCNHEIEGVECSVCGFSLEDDFPCPYLFNRGIQRICSRTGKQCNIIGLDFEDCNIFLKGK